MLVSERSISLLFNSVERQQLAELAGPFEVRHTRYASVADYIQHRATLDVSSLYYCHLRCVMVVCTDLTAPLQLSVF